MKANRSLHLIVLALGAAAAQGAIPTGYVVTDMGEMSLQGHTSPYGINNPGRTVGYGDNYNVAQHFQPAFISQGGVMAMLPVLPGGWDHGVGTDINDSSTVVGYCYASSVSDWVHKAFTWTAQVGTRPLPPLVAGDTTAALAINEAGDIVGWSGVDDDWHHACLWTAGQARALETFTAYVSEAYDVNNNGQVVGFVRPEGYGTEVAFLWENGVMNLLGFEGTAAAINDAGVVAGWAFFSGQGRRACVLRQGTLINIDPEGVRESRAYDINRHGQVVGFDSGGAFIWDDGVKANLNDLVPGDCGFGMSQAMAINDQGQIAVYASLDQQPWRRAVLLTPIPEPAALALLGLGGLLALRRRRR